MNTGTNLLWYRQNARNWNEALPLGNGRLGAMLYGGARSERISLNEDTLWTGSPSFYAVDGAAEGFKEAGRLAKEGKFKEAQSVLEHKCEGLWSQVYVAFGDIFLNMAHFDNVSGYRRTLDLSKGIHTVEYECDGVLYKREAFISYPDNVMVMRITASDAGAVSFDLSMTPAMTATTAMTDNEITVTGNCPTYVWHYMNPQETKRGNMVYGTTDAEKGMYYCGKVRVLHEGGTCSCACGSIGVRNADSATLLIDIRTSYNGWNKHPVLEGKPYIEPCSETLNKAAEKGFEAMLCDHLHDFSALYDRVFFDLGGGHEKYLPTDERLRNHMAGKKDIALYALYFNFGRYLTIASSREGTQATNLQGIWNNSITPPWNCNYTININTEMNYWPTLMVNLPECQEPLTRLINELYESGKRTAKVYYGASGTVSHHNTDIWRLSSPVGAHIEGSSVFACWPGSSGWLLRHLWEMYEYTNDKDYLALANDIIRIENKTEGLGRFLENLFSDEPFPSYRLEALINDTNGRLF